MGLPQKPQTLYTANGWYMDIPGLTSPRFETLGGLSRKTGVVSIVDAGTNIKYNFSGQILDFGSITLGRTLDGSSDDVTMDAFVTGSITEGIKYAGSLIKSHYGVEVFRIAFSGLLFSEDVWPEFNINSEEKLMKTYTAAVDEWIII